MSFSLIIIMKNKQKIFGLESTLSKSLDSLCLEVVINTINNTETGLLEILEWALNGEITKQQFSELYKSWMGSKNIYNVFTTKQLNILDKNQLYSNQIAKRSFFDVIKISLALELINQQYNFQYATKYSDMRFLESAEKLFSYLDTEGIIHLRYSQMLFLYFGLIMCGVKKPIQNTKQSIWKGFMEFVRSNNSVDGKWSLRNFKNYFLLNCNEQKMNIIMQFFQTLEKSVKTNSQLPSLYNQAFNNWKNIQPDRRKIEIYRRIFQEHQHMFFDFQISPQNLLLNLQNYYGKTCLNMYSIDIYVIKQLHQLITESCSRYIQHFLDQYLSAFKLRSLSPTKIDQQKSLRPRTTQSSIEKAQKILKTPQRKKHNKETTAQSQFLFKSSAEKVKHSKVELLKNLNYFKNKKIESFEKVMERLKNI